MKTAMILCAALMGVAVPAVNAAIVQVDIIGEVDFNGIHSGTFANVPAGTPTSMHFQVDSNSFLNGTFPTRGYEILQSSFTLTVGASTIGLVNPYPTGDVPYFVIRNNDPGVDGFLLASHPDVGQPDGVWTSEPAAFDPTFRALFQATYGGSTLSSLDILDALGTYTFAGLTVFNWGLEDASFQPTGFIFDHFTISVVPAPGAASLAGLGVMALARRRRR